MQRNVSLVKQPLFILSFVLMILVFVLMHNAPFALTRLSNLSGGFKGLDLLLYYDPFTVYSGFEALGSAGRAHYFYLILGMDILFPLLYAITYRLLIKYLCKLVNLKTWPMFFLSLVPILQMSFDYLENTSILFLLGFYPKKLFGIVYLASVMTSLKWLMQVFILLVVCGLGLRILIYKVVKEKNGLDVPRLR
jgi:hypothetical protein